MSQLEGAQLYAGRVGVFFGGSSGTGLVAAVEYQKLGGRVVLGASSESSFRRALANVRYLGGDRSAIKPIIGDVADSVLLEKNIKEVVEAQKREGHPVTDVFTFAAGGMPFAMELETNFFGPIRAIIAENPPDKDALLTAKKAELQRQYAIWLPESYANALAVNYYAKVNTVNFFLEATKGEQRPAFIDFNSIFGKEGKGPGFYRNVSVKQRFSLWHQEHAVKLAAEGMDSAEFIAPVIEDTDVGKIFLTKVVPIVQDNHPELAALMVRTKVKRVDVFAGMREFLEMTREQRSVAERPFERYIIGDNGRILIVKSIPEELKIDSDKFDI